MKPRRNKRYIPFPPTGCESCGCEEKCTAYTAWLKENLDEGEVAEFTADGRFRAVRTDGLTPSASQENVDESVTASPSEHKSGKKPKLPLGKYWKKLPKRPVSGTPEEQYWLEDYLEGVDLDTEYWVEGKNHFVLRSTGHQNTLPYMNFNKAAYVQVLSGLLTVKCVRGKEFKAIHLHVFAFLCSHSNMSKQELIAYPAQKTIAQNLHIDVQTARDALKDLEEMGLITRAPEKKPDVRSTVYKIRGLKRLALYLIRYATYD